MHGSCSFEIPCFVISLILIDLLPFMYYLVPDLRLLTFQCSSCHLQIPYLIAITILFLLFAALLFYIIRNLQYIQRLERAFAQYQQEEWSDHQIYGLSRARVLWRRIDIPSRSWQSRPTWRNRETSRFLR